MNGQMTIMFASLLIAAAAGCVSVPEVDNSMKMMRLPSVSFRSSANLMDAILYFQMASVPFDGSGEVILFGMCPVKDGESYPTLPDFKADNISMYDALSRVVDSVGAGLYIRGDGVVVVGTRPKNGNSQWFPQK